MRLCRFGDAADDHQVEVGLGAFPLHLLKPVLLTDLMARLKWVRKKSI